MTQTQTLTLTTPRCTCQHPTPPHRPQLPPPHHTQQGYTTYQPWGPPTCTTCSRPIPPAQQE